MTPNQTIYLVNQSPELLRAWRELSDVQKRMLLKACETTEEAEEIAMIIEEIIEGQRRLF